ncbi:hypothetical protein [Aurantimonas sp. 22II-16-19i]|uniref:hypothetical protein n=1 Tax=Aurantimonas sp. 22II-16-19i TaxID=1317114 RepID=UPI001FD8D0D8|nr:hypothetical protein [Aurantimonas sp. 22II-16-19i]
MRRHPSLKRPLIVYPLAFHLATLMISFAILVAVAIRIDSGGPYADEQITPVIARAITRNEDGDLAIRMTPELAELREATDDLWFVAETTPAKASHSVRCPSIMPRSSAGSATSPMRSCAIARRHTT